MLRLSIVFLILGSLILASTSVIVADDVKKSEKMDEPKKEDPKKESEKPAKLYDLKPKYTKDMEWDEEIKIKSSMYYNFSSSYSSNTADSMSMKVKAKIVEFKNNVPSKVKYSDCNGSGSIVESYGENEYTNSYKIVNGSVSADIASDLTLKVTENKNIQKDILQVFPGRLLAWFIYPERAVKVGDTWTSSELPVSKESFESDEGKFKDLKGTFKFEKVSKDKDKEIAHILWTGTCTLTKYQHSGPYSVKWKLNIKFDLANKRMMTSVGDANGALDEGAKAGLTVHFEKKAIYSKNKAAAEDTPVKPKDDEDE